MPTDLVEAVRYLVAREAQLEGELTSIRAKLGPIRESLATMPRVQPDSTGSTAPSKAPPGAHRTKMSALAEWIAARTEPFRAGDINIPEINKTQMASYVATARQMGYCERIAVGLYRRTTPAQMKPRAA